MPKKLLKQTKPLIAAGVGLGVGSAAITQLGGSARGLSTFSGFLPAMGAGLGGAAVIRSLDLLKPNKRRR